MEGDLELAHVPFVESVVNLLEFDALSIARAEELLHDVIDGKIARYKDRKEGSERAVQVRQAVESEIKRRVQRVRIARTVHAVLVEIKESVLKTR